jgi:large subunit ribosomal protein L35
MQQQEEGERMPKMKTDRGAAKRIKVTGTGRLRRRKAFRSHLLEHKSSVRTRRLGRETEISSADSRQVKRMLGR